MAHTLNSYGAIGPQQQLHFLKKLFFKIKIETQLTEHENNYLLRIEEEFTYCNQSTIGQQDVERLIRSIKAIISTIERNQETALIKHFKKYGVYRIFYFHPVLAGEDDGSNLINALKNGYKGIGVAALITLFFVITTLVGSPLWLTVVANALFAAAVTYLSAMLYGVVNDLLATKANLPYFLLGHQAQQKSLLRTNDPLAQGIAWGIAATFVPAVLASIAFGVGTVITASFVPIASFVFPVMFITLPLIAWGADLYAKRKAKQYIKEGHEYYGNLETAQLGSNYYQRMGLSLLAGNIEDKAAWLANSDRNRFGFTKLPLIGLGVLVSTITLSAVHSFLPVFLFSSLLVTTVPVVFAVAVMVFLMTAGAYMYLNRHRQIDNQFKLTFDSEASLEDKLYLDDDLLLVEELSKDFQPIYSSLERTEEPECYNNPLAGVHSTIKKSPKIVLEDTLSARLK